MTRMRVTCRLPLIEPHKASVCCFSNADPGDGPVTGFDDPRAGASISTRVGNASPFLRNSATPNSRACRSATELSAPVEMIMVASGAITRICLRFAPPPPKV